jgi:hypothetical protein
MKALFVAPLPFATVSGTTIAGSVANLNDDHAAYIWRASVTGSFTIDLGPDPVEYDTVALVGSNLRATDTVRVITSTTATGSNGYDSGQLAAWTGKKPRELTAKTIIKLPSVQTERYIRVSVTATGHPAGYVQAQRLVVGKAVSTIGIKFGAKMNFDDLSVITQSEDSTSIDRRARKLGWDITTTSISDQSWREEWAPLLLEVGSSSGLLFVRDESAPDTWQTDAIYGRITSKAYGEAEAYDWWTFSGTLLSFAP